MRDRERKDNEGYPVLHEGGDDVDDEHDEEAEDDDGAEDHRDDVVRRVHEPLAARALRRTSTGALLAEAYTQRLPFPGKRKRKKKSRRGGDTLIEAPTAGLELEAEVVGVGVLVEALARGELVEFASTTLRANERKKKRWGGR